MHRFGFEFYNSYIYYNTITVMNIEEIKGNTFEVDILNKGKEGNRLCYIVYNEKLGKFVISNCHYTGDPQLFTEAKNNLYGDASIESSDGLIYDIAVVLNVYNDNSNKGRVSFRY